MTDLIRYATAADAPALAAIYAPNVLAGVASFELEAPDAAEMRQRFEAVTARHPWLVYEREGRVLGYAYASEHNKRAAYRWGVDVTVYIDPTAHRQGIGRQLYRRLFHLLRALNLCSAYAGITVPNAGSVGLHEALGFRLVGIYDAVGYKFGAWQDVGWWQLDLCPRPDSPREPLAFASLDAGERQRLLTEPLTD